MRCGWRQSLAQIGEDKERKVWLVEWINRWVVRARVRVKANLNNFILPPGCQCSKKRFQRSKKGCQARSSHLCRLLPWQPDYDDFRNIFRSRQMVWFSCNRNKIIPAIIADGLSWRLWVGRSWALFIDGLTYSPRVVDQLTKNIIDGWVISQSCIRANETFDFIDSKYSCLSASPKTLLRQLVPLHCQASLSNRHGIDSVLGWRNCLLEWCLRLLCVFLWYVEITGGKKATPKTVTDWSPMQLGFRGNGTCRWEGFRTREEYAKRICELPLLS